MDEKIKTRWVDRLENGNIPQGTGVLGTPEGKRCCLGVLCDLAVEDGIIEPPEARVSGFLVYDKASISLLPLTVARWAGLNGVNGQYEDHDGRPHQLTNDNDGGKPFSQIAQIIKEYV